MGYKENWFANAPQYKVTFPNASKSAMLDAEFSSFIEAAEYASIIGKRENQEAVVKRGKETMAHYKF